MACERDPPPRRQIEQAAVITRGVARMVLDSAREQSVELAVAKAAALAAVIFAQLHRIAKLALAGHGSGPRPGPSLAGVGGEPRAAGGHSHVVPVHRPRGGRPRRLSLGAGLLGVLTLLGLGPNQTTACA